MEAFSSLSVPAMKQTSGDDDDAVRVGKLKYMLARSRLPLIAK
jgi:hypothetical protein